MPNRIAAEAKNYLETMFRFFKRRLAFVVIALALMFSSLLSCLVSAITYAGQYDYGILVSVGVSLALLLFGISLLLFALRRPKKVATELEVDASTNFQKIMISLVFGFVKGLSDKIGYTGAEKLDSR